MILRTAVFAFTLAQDQNWPKPAELQPGEVLRVYEQTMSRRGTYENILVLTPTKAYSKNGDVRNWTMLTNIQQAKLKKILAQDPIGLRSKKRPNPMWPSAYDGSDLRITYRIGRMKHRWGNNEYEYPDCDLTNYIEDIRTQLRTKSTKQGG
jgi:hypothetical protein